MSKISKASIVTNDTLLFCIRTYYVKLHPTLSPLLRLYVLFSPSNNATCAIPHVRRGSISRWVTFYWTRTTFRFRQLFPVSMDLAVISRTAIKRTRIRLSRILLAALNFMRISIVRKRCTQRRPLIAIELKIASSRNDERARRLSRNDVISGVNSALALVHHLLSLSRPITHNSKQHASLSCFFLPR